jgi:hypothetical protein
MGQLLIPPLLVQRSELSIVQITSRWHPLEKALLAPRKEAIFVEKLLWQVRPVQYSTL